MMINFLRFAETKHSRFQTYVIAAAAILSALSVSGCEESCPGAGVRDKAKAFESFKSEILQNHIGKLRLVGGDEKIFDDVLIETNNPIRCSQPKNGVSFTLMKPTFPPDRYLDPNAMTFFALTKGDCVACWDRIVVRSAISHCGSVSDVTIQRLPNWRSPKTSDGTWKRKGDAGATCGPIESSN